MQALQVIINGQVEFGFVNTAKDTIKLNSLMVKSEQQQESVRTSPEFLRCAQQEQLGYPLSPICELARHQASAIDEVNFQIFFHAIILKIYIFCY